MITLLNDLNHDSVPVSDQRYRLVEWNRTDVEIDSHKRVHDLFDDQALRTPEKTAVICRDQALTYASLWKRVGTLAGRLAKLGVGPETIVAISMERSLEMVVAMLGVLKAGAAYLPLDPGFPLDRLAFMLKDSAASVILTQPHLKDRFANSRAIVVALDETDACEADYNTAGVPDSHTSDATASSLAYLMYTSGSTGTPKGVMVEHRNVVNLFAGMDRVVGPEEGIWLAVTSISFDISVLELLWTLTRGFTIVLQTGEDGLAATGDYSIAAQLSRHHVTHFQCTPTLARALIRSPETLLAMKQLRKLFLGGEALPLPLANQLSDALSAEIFNMYGPTETTVWSTTHALTRSAAAVSIGRPIANTRIYILDEQGGLAPIGAAGELYIGGAGVSRGYWRRPDLTAEKFIFNSLEPDRHEFLYRTGDLARFRDNGEIEFIGRTDQQVKIRGFRIELGEIETVLGTHPAVHEAVAVARRDRAENPLLAAYIVARPGRNVSQQELKIYAGHKLPEYMIPSVITFLETMPLTPNGKIDRNALPTPNIDTIGGGNATLARASTDLERVITGIWQDALGLDTVGLQINLFDLGATSLVVAEVATCLRQRLKREIPLTDLFSYPTIAALAAHLSGGTGSSGGNSPNDSNRGAIRRQTLLKRTRTASHNASQ
ncbi:MAG: non-ribosomal peptide synthetase [Candidatus Binataceae bacterium]